MTATTTPTSPLPETATPERTRRRWPFALVAAVVLFGGWIAFLVIVGNRDTALAQATLPDGTILRLEQVTFGPKQKWVLQRPSPWYVNLLGRSRPEMSAFAEFGEIYPQCGVWLTRRDPTTHEPLDLDWLSHCTATDADGWESTSGLAGRCHWLKPPGLSAYQDTIYRYTAPFEPLPPGNYREIVVGASVPLLRARDGRFPLKVYNKQGEVVATFDAPYPAESPQQQEWTPVKFPATQTDGDLTVTLERIDWTLQPADAGVREQLLPTWKLSPIVKFHWRGEPSDDWRFVSERIMAVEDGLGNSSYLEKCRLTPHVPAWKLGFLILRKTDGRYEPHEEWNSGPIELPPACEFRDLDLQGQVTDQEDGAPRAAHVLKVFGPGKHQFKMVEPAVLGEITPPLAKEGAGWKVSAVHRPGKVDWTVESQQPFVVWKQPGQPQGRMDLTTRAFDGADGAQIATDDVYDSAYGNNTIVTILKSSPTSGTINLRPALVDMRNVYFYIAPPSEQRTIRETASEAQSEL